MTMTASAEITYMIYLSVERKEKSRAREEKNSRREEKKRNTIATFG
jgi:hypothetical protein